MKFTLLAKALSLLLVTILLMVCMQLIGNIGYERMQYREQAASSIRQSLAEPQVLAGPIFTRTCVETTETVTEQDKKKTITKNEQIRVLKSMPSKVQWKIETAIEPRYRGIYKVNSYRINANAEVNWASLEELAVPPVKAPVLAIRCAEPKIQVSINDPRGIRKVNLARGGISLPVQSITIADVFSNGFEAKPTLTEQALNAPQAFRLDIEMVGVESIGFVPLGDENIVEMTSDWPHPSFIGEFLPTEKSIANKGFSAKWTVSSLATSARPELLRGASVCALSGPEAAAPRVRNAAAAAVAAAATARGCIQSFGVGFIDPVNAATLADRATKYAFLFIAFTFVGVLLLEVLKGVRVHPIQYLLIGAALAVFFLLLLSLSEHMKFALAYAIAASGCIALIGFYVRSVFGHWRRALSTMIGLGVLYGVLYLVLKSEQHALLAGSLMIFALLAMVMLLTRGVDWSALGANLGGSAKAKPSPSKDGSGIDAESSASAGSVLTSKTYAPEVPGA